jgi:hypothetical protein
LQQTAVERLAAGERAMVVAGAFHVSYEAVRGWYHQWRDGDATMLELLRQELQPDPTPSHRPLTELAA